MSDDYDDYDDYVAEIELRKENEQLRADLSEFRQRAAVAARSIR